MWLIAGLGNPGSRYAETPHNMGFDAVGVLARRHKMVFGASRICSAEVATGEIAGNPVALIMPTTFMNLSGEAIVPFARYYKIPVEHVLAISDDVAIPWGRLRLREGGSHGGHNGLRNMILHFGGDRFPRLRIGCEPENWKGDLAAYVLAKLRGEALELARHMAEISADAIEELLARGIGKAMTRYNGYDAMKADNG